MKRASRRSPSAVRLDGLSRGSRAGLVQPSQTPVQGTVPNCSLGNLETPGCLSRGHSQGVVASRLSWPCSCMFTNGFSEHAGSAPPCSPHGHLKPFENIPKTKNEYMFCLDPKAKTPENKKRCLIVNVVVWQCVFVSSNGSEFFNTRFGVFFVAWLSADDGRRRHETEGGQKKIRATRCLLGSGTRRKEAGAVWDVISSKGNFKTSPRIRF